MRVSPLSFENKLAIVCEDDAPEQRGRSFAALASGIAHIGHRTRVREWMVEYFPDLGHGLLLLPSSFFGPISHRHSLWVEHDSLSAGQSLDFRVQGLGYLVGRGTVVSERFPWNPRRYRKRFGLGLHIGSMWTMTPSWQFFRNAELPFGGLDGTFFCNAETTISC